MPITVYIEFSNCRDRKRLEALVQRDNPNEPISVRIRKLVGKRLASLPKFV